MNITTNFTYEEFACKCGCGFNAISVELVKQLQEMRDDMGGNKKVTVTSGCRCKKHNETVGGEKNSQHSLGTAADIKVESLSPKEVYDYFDAKYPSSHGLGLYSTWVHIDVRPKRARW